MVNTRIQSPLCIQAQFSSLSYSLQLCFGDSMEAILRFKKVKKFFMNFQKGMVMAKHGILSSNKKALTPVMETDIKIFNHLKKTIEGTGVAQIQISKVLNIPQSTVSRRLSKMIGKRYAYGTNYYTIVYQNGLYKMLREEKNPSRSRLDYQLAEKRDELIERRSDHVKELAQRAVTEDVVADIITSTVVLYKVKRKWCPLVETVIKSLYSTEKIHDIVTCQNGVYIILKECDNLESVRNDICKLYKDVIKELAIKKQ